MDSYELKEQIGRSCFDMHARLLTGVTDIIFTNYKYEQYDGTFYSANTKTYFEIKTRNYLSNDSFPGKPNGWVIEKKKYDFLKELQKTETEKCRYLYINIFLDKMVIWDLTDLTIDTWSIDSFRKNNVSNETKEKEVSFLKVENSDLIVRGRINFKSIAESFIFLEQLKKSITPK